MRVLLAVTRVDWRPGLYTLSTGREPNNIPYCTCNWQRFQTEYCRSRVLFWQAWLEKKFLYFRAISILWFHLTLSFRCQRTPASFATSTKYSQGTTCKSRYFKLRVFFRGYTCELATLAFLRFRLAESRTIYPTVFATGSAFILNTVDVACISGKLDKRRFSFFSREILALFSISLFRFIVKERPLS